MLSKGLRKAFKSTRRDREAEAPSPPTLQISSPTDYIDSPSAYVSKEEPVTLTVGTRPSSGRPVRKSISMKLQKFPTTRESSKKEPVITLAPAASDGEEENLGAGRQRSVSVGDTDTRLLGSAIRRKEDKRGAAKNAKQVEMTHKIFTYLCNRHPWFAEGWNQEDSEITDQTFQDIVAILSGEKTSMKMQVKEAWIKHDFNLNTTISDTHLAELNSVREGLFVSLSFFVRELEDVLPQHQAQFQGSQITITRDPKLPLDEIVALYSRLITVLVETQDQQMIKNMATSLEKKAQSLEDARRPKDHTLVMAREMRTPLYINNLVIVQLESFIYRFGSISTQIIETLGTLQSQGGVLSHRITMELLTCLDLSLGDIRRILGATATSLALAQLQASIEEDDGVCPSPHGVNIYQFAQSQIAKEDIRACSLNGLVLRLTSPDEIDSGFMKTFFSTYRSFTTPFLLFCKLMERYHVPPQCAEDRLAIQMRVCIALKYWLNVNIRDFGHGLLERVRYFLEDTLKRDGYGDMAERLANTLQQSAQKETDRPSYTHTQIMMMDTPKSATQIFIDSSAKEIAEQLTCIAARTFRSLEFSELLNLSWSKPKTKHLSPHILEMIERSNSTAHWVATTIMYHEKVKDRSLVIAKFIEIAQQLRLMQNFDSVMGILAGLEASCVSRLKFSHLSLNDASVQVLDDLKALMEPQGSWKNYRAALHTITPPAIPYMGVYLTDLTFIEDGNSDGSPTAGSAFINFRKRELVSRVFQEIEIFQQSPYPLKPQEPLRTYLAELPYLDVESLYALSLQREPRNATFQDVL